MATINLFERLLEAGRRHQGLGRHDEAARVLGRLAAFPDLPAAVAEEARTRLAEAHLRRRRYARARRHLRAALRTRPASARHHFLMATAWQLDPRGDPRRAAAHFARARALDPAQARYRADEGLALLRLGRTEEGLMRLREAAGQAPDSAAAACKLVQGLLLAGQRDEARAAVRAARFRLPRSARVRQAWADFRFGELRRRRGAERLGDGGAPVLLPFARPADAVPGVRRDGPATLPGPHALRLARRRRVR